MILEIPCGNIESVLAAAKGGADRIELCSALSLDGITPSIGILEAIAEVRITKFVMIRPREGDFVYSKEEFRSMIRDIEHFKRAKADGIVSGVLLKNGQIDKARTAELISSASPLPFTFHRAFDMAADPFRTLEILVEIGAKRLLTSGQEADAYTGRELIADMVKFCGDQLIVVAGAGINPDNVESVLQTGVKEIHMSGKVKKTGYDVTDYSLVRKVKGMIN